MKKLIFPVLLILLCSFAIVEEWITAKIDSKVSLNLPKKPDKEKSGSSVIYSSDNDGCIFLVTVSPLPGKIALPTEPEKISKFLDGVLNGNLKSTNPEDVETKDVMNGSFQGKESSYVGTFPGTESRLKAVKQVLLVDRTLYVFDFWILDEEYADSAADKEKFFSSIKITQ
jgi:hypothetical protein